ncbi:hypothetical protein [Pseudomonas sp. GXZC]|uniref:hypothetical protein n=1 Tax=Pseudomonas sp. GXZC TaxID=3003351 RepID=UPI0022AA01F5|nr:hypothetical protein [Pseudomonas sp. GXZC]WAT28975.1 hypothetical protein OZ428_01095 [Pseudomonas sp. GXZC]
MSINEKQLEVVLTTLLADVGLAVAAIVLAIKRQPGFDVAAYDADIETLLAIPDRSKTFRTILETTLSSEED